MEKKLSFNSLLFHKTPEDHKLAFSSTSPTSPWAPPLKLNSLMEEDEEEEEEEIVMRGLSSDRLFFESGGTSSLLVETEGKDACRETTPAFDCGVAVAVDSTDPLGDFRVSMEEMVEAHGVLIDWAWMQEMLGWFLRANGKGNHGFIISAFLDLVVSLASSSSFSSSPFESCPLSCSSSSSYSCNQVEEMEGDENE
ncbi:hypothetical protein KFK09_000642 [Dendrobium nobile]|uniref:Transcription repressor n=1 Tax=Dendrobium nobile TaxID=94219 RepID=A0A8T3CFI1_DENNO|nr:hypothetical protein KFK09_000642 [Dendrobium nobile]